MVTGNISIRMQVPNKHHEIQQACSSLIFSQCMDGMLYVYGPLLVNSCRLGLY